MFGLASALTLTCQNWWQSSLRYALVVFPIYIMLARLSGRRWVYTGLLSVSLIGLALLALQYARGWRAF